MVLTMEPVQTLQSDTVEPAAGDPCPTPLNWREVVDRFQQNREDFDLTVGENRVRGAAIGSGPALCFLNPASGDFDQFALLAWLLREQFRCIFANYPRPERTRDHRLAQACASIVAAADRCDEQEYSLFAPGWGSLVAVQAMLTVPDRIPSCVLACGFAHRELTRVEQGLLAWGGLWPGTLSKLPGWKALQQQNHRPWFPPYDESRWEFLCNNLGATSVCDASRRFSVLSATDLRPRLGEIGVPVLLVRTEGEGALLTNCQEDLQSGLPHATTEWMHTSGQYSYLTHPHRLAKLITSFILDQRTNRAEH